MSILNLGKDDVTPEMQSLKDRLASKDSEIASLRGLLMKRDSEIQERNELFNETVHKLAAQSAQVLSLERELASTTEDLSRERNALSNTERTLSLANERIKQEELNARDLQANLDTLSHTSDTAEQCNTKLLREKATLEARVRELLVNASAPVPPAPTPRRPRSSSVANSNSTSVLERELSDARAALAKHDADAKAAFAKLSTAQTELINIGNAKTALEKSSKAQLEELRASLEDKEEELVFLRAQSGGGQREQELLTRIDEDEAKISALEKACAKTQRQLAEADSEGAARLVELVRGKEEALDSLEEKVGALRASEARIKTLERTEKQLTGQLSSTNSPFQDATFTAQDAGLYPRQSTPLPTNNSTQSVEAAATDVERLLAAVDRLRGERDTLRGHVEFLETESKFAVEAREKQVNDHAVDIDSLREDLDLRNTELATAFAKTEELKKTVSALELERDDLAARLSTLETQAVRTHELEVHADTEIHRLTSAARAGVVVVSNLQSKLEGVTRDLTMARAALVASQEETAGVQVAYEDLQEAFEDKDAQLADVRITLVDEEAIREELGLEVAAVQTEVSDARTRLLEAETTNDALRLELTNIHSNLIDAETRYTELQMNQLSSMSTTETTRALQRQLEDERDRVARRTEQIGLHQRDIRRLETNLKLQEERIGELTTENEAYVTSNMAMVEDCAATRDARDEARAKVETLEVEVELAEAREMERSVEVQAMVCVLADHALRTRLRAPVGVGSKVVVAQDDGAVRQATLALAVSRIEVKNLSQSVVVLEGLRVELEQERQGLQDQLEVTEAGHIEQVTSLKAQIQATEATVSVLDAATRTHQEEIATLRAANLDLECQLAPHAQLERDSEALRAQLESTSTRLAAAEATHAQHAAEAARASADLQSRLTTVLDKGLVGDQLENELAALRAAHQTETQDLQAQLDAMIEEIAGASDHYAEAEKQYRESLAAAEGTVKSLEERLAASVEGGKVRDALEAEVARLGVQIDQLKDLLQTANRGAQETEASRVELATRQQQLEAENTRVKQDHSQKLAERDQQAGLLAKEAEDAQDHTQVALQRVAELEERIEHEAAAGSALQAQVLSLTSHCEEAEAKRDSLQNEMVTIQEHLEKAASMLDTLRGEKEALQSENTDLGAQVQRSLSAHRFLENKESESRQHIVALTQSLDRVRAECARAEQTSKSIEMQLALDTAQHDQVTNSLRRELATLKTQPNVAEAVAELEQKNVEMEALLRSKTAEVEENDDRFIELLKEKKKLNAKIETLSRKVLSLQTKLANAKEASVKAPTPLEGPPTPISANISHPNPPPVPTIPDQFMSGPVAFPSRPSTNSVASGSTLPRSKTPERRPVFKARTPERRQPTANMVAGPSPHASTSSIGRKRPAPDDFECVEKDGYEVDSVRRDPAHSTPRRRLGSQSGFTPVRHHVPRAVAPVASPRRVTTHGSRPPLLNVAAEAVNTSRSVSSSHPGRPPPTTKRSWLGTIRATPGTQGASSGSMSRSVSTPRTPAGDAP